MPVLSTWAETGSTQSRNWTMKQGKKQVPFVPTVKPPLNYYLRGISMDANCAHGPAGDKCGTSYWGEAIPAHLHAWSNIDSNTVSFNAWGNDAYARAYAKFRDMVYTKASDLTAIAEIGKTRQMIFARLSQLHKGAKALRGGRFKEFLDTFGIRPLKKHENTRWTRPKQFGALWLEYWMGWAPTVGDIVTSIDTLSKVVPTTTVRAGSSVPISYSYSQQSGNAPWIAKATTTWVGKGTVWVQANVQVTNPNLHIAQKLGLINVAQTIWETIGFSWLINWFTNVGQILGQFTDWVGLQLSNTIISVKTVISSSWSLTNAPVIFGGGYPGTMFHTKRFNWFSRTVTGSALPLVKPTMKVPNGLSLTRGATLASLLATMFAPLRNAK